MRHYLANSKFTVFTDNVLVKYLQNRTVRVASGVGTYSFKATILRSNTDLVQKSYSRSLVQSNIHRHNLQKKSSDLADHICSVQTPKEYTEVTLIYYDEDEAVVAAAIEPTMPPAVISFENLSTKQKACPNFKHLYS